VDPNDARLDPLARRLSRIGGVTWAQQRDLIQQLQDPTFRSLVTSLDVDVEEINELHARAGRSLVALLQGAIYFGPLGSTITGHNIASRSLIEAVHIWESTQDEARVDAVLTAAWNPVVLRGSLGPLTTLAGHHEPTLETLLARKRLLDIALAHHDRGEFEASTMIVLSQVDGLTLDFTEGRHGFFYHGSDQLFVDEATVAGMPDFLATVYRAINRSDDTTSSSTAFRRHPIMHGRYFAFGSATNSTKAFALLSGVLEWLRPKAFVLTEKWQKTLEASQGPRRPRAP
jgi:hypothetical protein